MSEHYTHVNSSYKSVKSIFTINCYKKYIDIYVFIGQIHHVIYILFVLVKKYTNSLKKK
jgi:hypothetical protein